MYEQPRVVVLRPTKVDEEQKRRKTSRVPGLNMG